MTGKNWAGVILIFLGILRLIITFYAIFALFFASVFCGSAPNGCDAMNAIILRELSVTLVFCIILYILYPKWRKPSEIAPKVA